MSIITNLEFNMLKRAKDFVYYNNTWINDVELIQTSILDKNIFGLDYNGKTIFPIYMFDKNIKPLPIISKLINIFGQNNFWNIAIWLESINGDFGGKSPKEFLISQPDKVLQYAIESLQPIEHA